MTAARHLERLAPRLGLLDVQGEATLWSSEGGHASPTLELEGRDVTQALEEVLELDRGGRYRLRVRVDLLLDRGPTFDLER